MKIEKTDTGITYHVEQGENWTVDLPRYIAPFMLIQYDKKVILVRFSVPFKHLFQVIWWSFPKWLFDRQFEDCVTYIPDYVDSTGRAATGTKVKSFLGLVIRNEQGALYRWNWWKYLERK